VDEVDFEIAVVGEVEGEQGLVALVDLVDLPVGEGRVEEGHAEAGNFGRACGDDDFEAFVVAADGGIFAAVREPEDAEGEYAVDG
jgi:hypothetical protein